MAMIFVNRDSQNIGQFTDQEISNGLQSGRFFPADLGWREGMEAWQPLSAFTDLPPAGAAAGVPPVPGNALAEFQQPGLIRFDECLNKAWERFKINWGLCVVATLILFAASAVVQIPMQFAEVVFRRYTGHGAATEIKMMVAAGIVFLFFYVLATAVSSILSAGFMYFFIETVRTGKAKLENVFAGFRGSVWVQLLLAMLVWLAAVVALVAVVVTPGVYFAVTMKSRLAIFLSAALVLVPLAYFSVGIAFVFPLIVDKKIGFWQAIMTSLKTVHRQWFRAFGLLVLVALVGSVGVIACCVGMLGTLPIGYLIWGQGYRQLFGDGELKPPA